MAEIVTLSLGTTVTTAAFWYFMLAVLVLLLAVGFYFILLRMVSVSVFLNNLKTPGPFLGT